MSIDEISVQESWELSNLTLDLGQYNKDGSSMSRFYIVDNAESEQDAVEAAYQKSPDKIFEKNAKDGSNNPVGIPKQSATVVERCGERTWKVQVDYGFNSDSSNTSDSDEDVDSLPEVSFQCSASTSHIVRPYDQLLPYRNKRYPDIINPEKVMIGWNGEFGSQSQASGVDVYTGECREQYKRILSYDTVRSSNWRRRIASCVGRANRYRFKGWNAGEAMFMGCSYNTPQRKARNVEVTFDFLIKVNEEDAVVCGHHIGLLRGFEYAWVVMGDAVSQNAINREIKYIFKSSVCKYADFSKLGL